MTPVAPHIFNTPVFITGTLRVVKSKPLLDCYSAAYSRTSSMGTVIVTCLRLLAFHIPLPASVFLYCGMIFVGDVMISEDIAFARFACNTGACKGACCVVGSAGAPVTSSEIPVLNKAWSLLKDELRPQSREAVADKGLIRASADGDFELSTIGDAECVFVQFSDSGTAFCSIQKAFYEGRFHWPKPISCHLFPIRATTIGAVTYLNFEFVPEICEPAVNHAKSEGIWLSDYIREPLQRRFGSEWADEFQAACQHVRSQACEDER